LRKGAKREFPNEEAKKLRRESAIFWEERNNWFSDVWFDIKGTLQALNDKDARLRSAAYPFEVVYRLVNMYSLKGDTVLDPFLGTGTTTAAAIASGRNSIGYEIEPSMENIVNRIPDVIVDASNQLIRKRLARHLEFVADRLKTKGGLKYVNEPYGFPVVTAQENELIFNDLLTVKKMNSGMLAIDYSNKPQPEFCKDWAAEFRDGSLESIRETMRHVGINKSAAQMKLFS
jgi:hypothetical protein